MKMISDWVYNFILLLAVIGTAVALTLLSTFVYLTWRIRQILEKSRRVFIVKDEDVTK